MQDEAVSGWMAVRAAAVSCLILIRGFRSEGYSNLGCAFPPLIQMHQGGGPGASDGAELRETIVELKETNEVGPSFLPWCPWNKCELGACPTILPPLWLKGINERWVLPSHQSILCPGTPVKPQFERPTLSTREH